MARQIRIEFEGAFYHVMSRGNNGDKIFFGKAGHESFLKGKSKWGRSVNCEFVKC